MNTPFSPANLAFMLLASFILVRAKNTALRSFRSRGTRAVALACLKRQRHSDPHPSRASTPPAQDTEQKDGILLPRRGIPAAGLLRLPAPVAAQRATFPTHVRSGRIVPSDGSRRLPHRVASRRALFRKGDRVDLTVSATEERAQALHAGAWRWGC